MGEFSLRTNAEKLGLRTLAAKYGGRVGDVLVEGEAERARIDAVVSEAGRSVSPNGDRLPEPLTMPEKPSLR